MYRIYTKPTVSYLSSLTENQADRLFTTTGLLASIRRRAPLNRYLDQYGLAGCWHYWTHTLNEEAADFMLTLDEEAGYFRIDMHHCPSKAGFLNYSTSNHLMNIVNTATYIACQWKSTASPTFMIFPG
jgi:hypothetical protein